MAKHRTCDQVLVSAAARLVINSQDRIVCARRVTSLDRQTLNERYRVTAKLGEGGMGVVYEAQHTLIDRRMSSAHVVMGTDAVDLVPAQDAKAQE